MGWTDRSVESWQATVRAEEAKERERQVAVEQRQGAAHRSLLHKVREVLGVPGWALTDNGPGRYPPCVARESHGGNQEHWAFWLRVEACHDADTGSWDTVHLMVAPYCPECGRMGPETAIGAQTPEGHRIAFGKVAAQYRAGLLGIRHSPRSCPGAR